LESLSIVNGVELAEIVLFCGGRDGGGELQILLARLNAAEAGVTEKVDVHTVKE
jgi:hypothetical protein